MWVGFDAAKRLSIGLRSRQTPKLAVGFRFAAKPMTPAHSQPLPDDLFLLRVAEQAQLLPSCKTVLRDFHQSPPARLPQIENEPLTPTPLITIIHIVRPKTLIEGSFSYPLDSDRISNPQPGKTFSFPPRPRQRSTPISPIEGRATVRLKGGRSRSC